MAGTRGRLTIEMPAPDVYLVRASGRLDVLTGVRILRLLDTRLALLAKGVTATRCVLVDVTGLLAVEHVGVRLLERAVEVARLQGVELAIVAGDGPDLPVASRDQARLAALPRYASVAVALDTLDAGRGRVAVR